MLVKIVALGLDSALWKNVLHHLRAMLPQEPFSAAIFSSADEIAYLEQEYFPAQWEREAPDIILTDPGTQADWENRLQFLRKVYALSVPKQPKAVLTLHTLEHGLKQLVQGRQPVTFHLDNGIRFSLTDPSLLLTAFPEQFPRIRVSDHLSAVRLSGKRGQVKEIKPAALPLAALVGFSQIESVRIGDRLLSPEEWIKGVARAEGVRVPANTPLALYRDPEGVFLFSGLPIDRVQAVTVGGVGFTHIIDLGLLSEISAGFAALGRLVARAGAAHTESIDSLTARLRDAENRTDLPVFCTGGHETLSRVMSALLSARGYRRVSVVPPDQAPDGEEQALLLEVAPGTLEGTPRVNPNLGLSIGEELAPDLALLDGFTEWRQLSPADDDNDAGQFRAHSQTGREAFRKQRDNVSSRADKAQSGLDFTERRILLLGQETKVQTAARENLELILGPTVRTWDGTPPDGVNEVLVLSYDTEEGHHVLQALPGVAKKRWFDLSSCTDADALQNLNLDPIRAYAAGGAVVMTAAARERLAALRVELAGQAGRASDMIAEARAAREEYRKEIAKSEIARRELARMWIWQVLDGWLRRNERRLLDALGVVRERHEREWFNRGQVNRVVIAASNEENRKALTEACHEVYPHFNPELSVIIPYDYQPLDALPDKQHQAILAERSGSERSGSERSGSEQSEAKKENEKVSVRLAQALAAQNARNLDDYLQVVAPLVADLPRADLVLIENQPEVAERLLLHLRGLTRALSDAPAVLALPDTWNPTGDSHLAWPRTRTIVIRRMGALTTSVCVKHLRGLYAM
ncbi:MAG: hypothetical protein IID61_04380 [SAR324 cluster bacterium]|nr:hypothetical protein [SAR324 cluster bacterium]